MSHSQQNGKDSQLLQVDIAPSPRRKSKGRPLTVGRLQQLHQSHSVHCGGHMTGVLKGLLPVYHHFFSSVALILARPNAGSSLLFLL